MSTLAWSTRWGFVGQTDGGRRLVKMRGLEDEQDIGQLMLVKQILRVTMIFGFIGLSLRYIRQDPES